MCISLIPVPMRIPIDLFLNPPPRHPRMHNPDYAADYCRSHIVRAVTIAYRFSRNVLIIFKKFPVGSFVCNLTATASPRWNLMEIMAPA